MKSHKILSKTSACSISVKSRGLPTRNATVAKAFIDLILKVDAMEEVQQTLQKQGGDVFSFIEAGSFGENKC